MTRHLVFLAFGTLVFGIDAFGVRPSAFGIASEQPILATIEALRVRAPKNGRFTLVLKVTPRAGIHIYAPPEDKYRPIALTIDPVPGVRVGKPRLPRSVVRTFEGEQVRVYEKPFSITVPVVLAREASPPLQIKGTVSYQACDDLICYLPVSVPVAWTLTPER
ncbi:MAG TPA: protein-disulfide reductase DsbD N-terminal domain-containing protein [Vicinamibacterales bacterium]|nr:protein-disulfide reductase DsbD N-terminal domain-containing protein [Vicinamibacterales bacterium]